MKHFKIYSRSSSEPTIPRSPSGPPRALSSPTVATQPQQSPSRELVPIPSSPVQEVKIHSPEQALDVEATGFQGRPSVSPLSPFDNLAPSILSPTTEERIWAFSWVANVGAVNLRQLFQNFLCALLNFAREFRTAKYAGLFLSMAAPVQALLLLLRADSPPQDVMIATLSGCITTLLDQITFCKSGRKKQKEFLTHLKSVTVALTKLISGLQEGIRLLNQPSDNKEGEFRWSPRGSVSKKRPSLVELLPYSRLVEMINELMQPPLPPSCKDLGYGTLQDSPHCVLVGCGLIYIAAGSLMCAAWYREIKFWSIVIPASECVLGIIFLIVAFVKSYTVRLKKDEVGLFAKTQKRSRDVAYIQEQALSVRSLKLFDAVSSEPRSPREMSLRLPPSIPPKIYRPKSLSPNSSSRQIPSDLKALVSSPTKTLSELSPPSAFSSIALPSERTDPPQSSFLTMTNVQPSSLSTKPLSGTVSLEVFPLLGDSH